MLNNKYIYIAPIIIIAMEMHRRPHLLNGFQRNSLLAKINVLRAAHDGAETLQNVVSVRG
jgi:hypothetical protein